MADVCIIGGGIGGLLTALLLSRDQHRVTVLEQDSGPPSADAEDVWSTWQRWGVPQARQVHLYHAGFRNRLEAHLPHVHQRLVEAGAQVLPLGANPPATVADRRPRPGDDRLSALACRRTTLELALRQAADIDPRVDLRSGVTAVGLHTESIPGAAPPDPIAVRLPGGRTAGQPLLRYRSATSEPIPVARVVGVATDTGPVAADLVVDANGRRSPVPDWLEAAGAARPRREAADYGIEYWTQWFRLHPGASFPSWSGPPTVLLGECGIVRVPVDGGHFSITVYVAGGNRKFRVLRDTDRFVHVCRRLDFTRAWVDPEVVCPVGTVLPMPRAVDQRTSYVVDGRPCATGLVAVGDALACTNPALGRGTTFAFMHAELLREALAHDSDPDTLPLCYDRAVADAFDPWFRATRASDDASLAALRAAAAGTVAEPDPVTLFRYAAAHDADLWRAAAAIVGVVDLPETVLARPEVAERLREVLAGLPPYAPPALPWPELLAG